MPEAGIYLCDADMLEVGEVLFAAGASLVPDEEYSTPQFTMIASVPELERTLAQKPHSVLFFAISPAWQQAPLEIKSLVKGGRTIFYHVQKSGGPSLDLYYPRPFDTASGPQLRPGFLAYHAQYWNPTRGAMESAPEALVEWYKRLRSMLAKGARRVREGPRSYIVTKNVDRLGIKLSAT